jgi:phosphatidylethanolamine-binding protein (PEBP) family uncharacterized protein
MKTQRQSRFFAKLLPLALALAGAACSSTPEPSDPGGPGSGGSSGQGGAGGSKPAGTGGSTAGSGGTSSGTGGSSAIGGSDGSGTGGSGGSQGASGGPTGTGGDGSGGATGSGGTTADASPADMSSGEAGLPAGEFVLKVTGVDMRNGKLYFKSGQTRGTGHMSPAFEWGAVPDAKSYAISMYDTANNNTHWVMYDIPANVTKLPEKLAHMVMAPEAPPAKNTSFAGGIGYFGPGADCRTYNFEVHAMKVEKLTGVGANNALRTMLLPANRSAKTPAVGVIGQSSGAMCP